MPKKLWVWCAKCMQQENHILLKEGEWMCTSCGTINPLAKGTAAIRDLADKYAEGIKDIE